MVGPVDGDPQGWNVQSSKALAVLMLTFKNVFPRITPKIQTGPLGIVLSNVISLCGETEAPRGEVTSHPSHTLTHGSGPPKP